MHGGEHMKLDRPLLDKGRPPTVAEMKDYFNKNDYTTAPPIFDTSHAKREEMNVYMKAKAVFKENWLKISFYDVETELEIIEALAFSPNQIITENPEAVYSILTEWNAKAPSSDIIPS